MIDIKHKTFVILSGTVLATQRSLATVRALMCPSRCLSWLLGILTKRHLYGCLALFLATRRPPGRIGPKHPKTIDAARESAIFRRDKPYVCTFSLPVKGVCCADICRGVGLDMLITECLVAIKLLCEHDGR